MGFWSAVIEWFFPRITHYEFSPKALRTMQAMALQTYPKEAFAVLRGKHRGKTLFITELAYQPFTNTEHSAQVVIDRYTLTDMVGTFHSHPGFDAQPSRADRRLFAKYPGVHCILAKPYTAAHVYNQAGSLLSVHPIIFRGVKQE